MLELAQSIDLEGIKSLIDDYSVTLILLAYFIWQNHIGKKGIIEKLTALEDYERETMKVALDNSTKVIEHVNSTMQKLKQSITHVLKIFEKLLIEKKQ